MGSSNKFPRNAKYNAVMGILRLLVHNDKKLTVGELTEMFNSEVDDLLQQVTAARLLGFVRLGKGVISLTPLGEKMHVLDPEATEEAKKNLLKYEPFKSAYYFSKKAHKFTTAELEEKLLGKGVYWYSDSGENRSVLKGMLMQWAIHFNILDYDGTEKIWMEE